MAQIKLIAISVFLSITGTLGLLYGVVQYAHPAEVGLSAVTDDETGQTTPMPIPDVVDTVIPAVVSVVVTAEVPIIERYYEEYAPFGFFGGNFAIPRERQVGTEEREIGGGTGFFVSADGYIVTNKHVVESDEVSYSILTNEGATHQVEVVARDPMLDIAVLKVVDSEELFPYIEFDTEVVRLGETVIAIGNALAEFPNSVSVGVVSGLARNIVAQSGFGQTEALEGVIQTDAAINFGNSGGPLINRRGAVVGVNVAVAGGSENIGFALPAATVAEVYESVARYGEIRRPFLGVRYVQLTPEIASYNNVSIDTGVLVVSGDRRDEVAVVPDSPADKAGIKENDIILEIEGVPLDGKISLGGMLREYAVGEEVALTVYRDGEEKTVLVTLEAAPMR